MVHSGYAIADVEHDGATTDGTAESGRGSYADGSGASQRTTRRTAAANVVCGTGITDFSDSADDAAPSDGEVAGGGTILAPI
jgi:hypothetical protein